MHGVCEFSANKLAKLIRNRDISVLEVVNAHIDRIELVNPRLNAVVAERFSAARREALEKDKLVGKTNLPPLFGIPFTVKEMLGVKGLPNTAGALRWKGSVAQEDCDAVKLLREAGAIPVAISNQSEFSFGMETTNLIYGRTKNPHDESKVVGGSSGGEAAIIAAGGSPFGLGTELAGSIRMPAHYCGIYGHMPTHGSISLKGIGALHDKHSTSPGGPKSPYLTIGPMARRAEDLATLSKVLRKDTTPFPQVTDEEWKGKKVFVLANPKLDKAPRVDKQISTSVEHAGGIFKKLGAQVETFPVELIQDSFQLWVNCITEAAGMSLANVMGGETKLNPAKELLFSLMGKPRYSLSTIFLCLGEQLKVFKADLNRAHSEIEKRREKFNAVIGDGILLMPTQPRVAPGHNQLFLHPHDIAYTCLFNLLQCPVTAVPCGLSSQKLPMGIQVIAKPGNDLLTIRAAMTLE